MFSKIFTFTLVVTCVIASVFPNFRSELDFRAVVQKKDWWETASFYQIYPRSFRDSDVDGIGDIKGIIQKLPYLKEIGVTATWLSPIFASPMVDFGYDISNFYDIEPDYGTMEDFEELVITAKNLGIKLILDFVPNHSSNESDWFKKSIKKDPKYKDFYIWHPGKKDEKNTSNLLPPNNWLSVFRGSAWEWNDERKEFYFHQFAVQQPDLNYRNPAVKKQMEDVLTFWLNKGVDGFRIDAIPHLIEVDKDPLTNRYPDETHNPNSSDPEDYGYLIHNLTVDRPETLDVLYDWRAVLDDFKTRTNTDTKVILAETYSPMDIKMKYYGNGTREGAQMPFNFLFITDLDQNSDAYKYSKLIDEWMTKMPEGRTANWVLGNHDKSRVATRIGTDRIDLLNMILLTLPGASVTYYGEEIGMTDVWISWNDTVDPQACNSNENMYEKLSRDPQRTPFQWNDDVNAGFSSGNNTWLPVAPNYKDVNIKRQRGVARSHLNIYKDLQELRQSKTIQYGNYTAVALNDNVLAILRCLEGEDTYLTLVNLNRVNYKKINLSQMGNLPDEFEYHIVNDVSGHRKGEIVKTLDVSISGQEAVILKAKKQPAYYSYTIL